MRIVAVHKLPWDEAAFRAEVEEIGMAAEDEIRDYWSNAWLFITESTEPVDFGDFGLRTEPGQELSDFQAAWQECELSSNQAAFYLHYYKPGATLFYRGKPVGLPEPSSPSADLLRMAPYTSPV